MNKALMGGHRGQTPKLVYLYSLGRYNKIFCPPIVSYAPGAEHILGREEGGGRKVKKKLSRT